MRSTLATLILSANAFASSMNIYPDIWPIYDASLDSIITVDKNSVVIERKIYNTVGDTLKLATITPDTTRVTEVVFDSLRRPREVVDGDFRLTYAFQNEKLAYTQSGPHSTTYERDSLGNTIGLRNNMGSPYPHYIMQEVNSFGDVIMRIDPMPHGFYEKDSLVYDYTKGEVHSFITEYLFGTYTYTYKKYAFENSKLIKEITSRDRNYHDIYSERSYFYKKTRIIARSELPAKEWKAAVRYETGMDFLGRTIKVEKTKHSLNLITRKAFE